jgi:hypothetical protein
MEDQPKKNVGRRPKKKKAGRPFEIALDAAAVLFSVRVSRAVLKSIKAEARAQGDPNLSEVARRRLSVEK